MSKRLQARIEDDKLVVEIPIYEPARPSKSGKTLVVASSEGNKPALRVDDQVVYIGLNAYYYAPDSEANSE